MGVTMMLMLHEGVSDVNVAWRLQYDFLRVGGGWGGGAGIITSVVDAV